MYDAIFFVIDPSGGHITGATLIGPLTEDELSSLTACSYCNIAVYGEGSQDAVDLLMENGFAGRMYLGPSIDEYIEAGFALITAESIVPRCTTDTIIQEACEARWLADGGDSGSSGGSGPPPSPITPTNEPESTPTREPSTANTPAEEITIAPTSPPTSGMQFISAMFPCVIGGALVFLL